MNNTNEHINPVEEATTVKKPIIPGTESNALKAYDLIAWDGILRKEVLSVDSLIYIFTSDNEIAKRMLRQFLDAMYSALHSEGFDFEERKEEFSELINWLNTIK